MSLLTDKIKVSINSQKRTTVRTVGISALAPAVTQLSDLTDVDASDPDANETLVYNSQTQKYEVKVIPMIDGGQY
jgi:hypothetical protein